MKRTCYLWVGILVVLVLASCNDETITWESNSSLTCEISAPPDSSVFSLPDTITIILSFSLSGASWGEAVTSWGYSLTKTNCTGTGCTVFRSEVTGSSAVFNTAEMVLIPDEIEVDSGSYYISAYGKTSSGTIGRGSIRITLLSEQ